MNRNILVLMIAGLGVGAGILGDGFYLEQHPPRDEISVGPRGVTIQGR